MDRLLLHIESLIFVAQPSVSFDDIKNTLETCFNTVVDDAWLSDSLDTLIRKYSDESYSFEIVEMAGGFRFMTKTQFHETIGTYLKQNSHKRLSKSALETLSIIAYKQPVTKTEIEMIRGVNSDYTVQKLLEKDLIEISGRSEGPGKPLLYSTSDRFFDYFGMKNIGDLPKIKELDPIDHQMGQPESIESEPQQPKQ